MFIQLLAGQDGPGLRGIYRRCEDDHLHGHVIITREVHLP